MSKFKIEFTETDYYEEDKEKYDIKFTAYGDTAKETVLQMAELREEYHNYLIEWGDKNIKKVDNKKELK